MNYFSPAPIILFVYNRPRHTRKAVEALQKCELATESDLYIFADGPKKNATGETKLLINEVREYIHNIDVFHSVYINEAEKNIGCADSIINGVNQVISKYDRAIIVEDDIVVHPFFLRFMNESLNFYESNKNVFAISATMEYFRIPPGYNKDVFLTYRFGAWGWAIWKDRWDTLNWDIDSYPIFKKHKKKQISSLCRGGDDLWEMLNAQRAGQIDAWDIRLLYNMNLQNRLCLRPVQSFVNNIGMDGSGVHCGDIGPSLLPMYNKDTYSIILIKKIRLDKKITKEISKIFHRKRVSKTAVIQKIIKKLKKLLIK